MLVITMPVCTTVGTPTPAVVPATDACATLALAHLHDALSAVCALGLQHPDPQLDVPLLQCLQRRARALHRQRHRRRRLHLPPRLRLQRLQEERLRRRSALRKMKYVRFLRLSERSLTPECVCMLT